jgi:aryl-alcohol dehydrogenase-like predicted oxidoreductase
MTDAHYDKVEKLETWAREHSHSLAELAQAWLLAQPAVCSAISGATRVEHIQANARAAEWRLSADEVTEVNQILAD